ncbi:MAG: succinylglutamate desuccinylase/aspartoacylase family protein [Thermoanaerobaculia bacterium]|nr:succinylglutamate desuccinylase/aspartoacylase family protein [Thermoanaerobaculia bacterium]
MLTRPDPEQDGLEVRRLLGRLRGSEAGPTLICLGGIHGNEPAGIEGILRVFRALEAKTPRMRGELVGLAGNRRALRNGRRFLQRDLNRIWLDEAVARVRSGKASSPEEKELAELDRELREIMERARGRVYLLDLHTTSGPGPAFGLVEDSLVNRRFGMTIPAPIVLGIEEELDGTVLHFMSRRGVTTVGFEAGQHRDPRAPERAAGAVWVALERAGLLDRRHPEAVPAIERLRRESRNLPRVVEVRYRHGFAPDDRFQMDPGHESFEPVVPTDPIASDLRGPVAPPEPGLLLMPLYQSPGEDGFFVVRPVKRLWLRVSTALRHLRADRVLPHLPGVEHHPERPDAFLVDRAVARWFALELFHLLGFRRKGPTGRYLTMVRRHDGIHH